MLSTNLEFFTISTTSTGPTFTTIPEPYFSSDFNRALDSQPLLNNAVDARLSDIYQDIDYNSGVITPTNFDLLISGSALKATVQDSNYTLLRHTLTPEFYARVYDHVCEDPAAYSTVAIPTYDQP